MGDLTKVIVQGPDGTEAPVIAGVPPPGTPALVVYNMAAGGGGGGGPVTIADGADVAEGSTTDAAWNGIAPAATVVSILKKMATSGTGGGPATIADGADVAEGATTDVAVVTDAAGTVSGKLRGLVKWAFERMPASLGQKLMALSFPVTLASDQSAVPVQIPTSSVVGTLGPNPVTLSLLGQPGAGFHIAFGTLVAGGQISVEETWDGVNWSETSCYNPYTNANRSRLGRIPTAGDATDWVIRVDGGAIAVRVNPIVYTGGAGTVTLNATGALTQQGPSEAAGNEIVQTGMMVAGLDGTQLKLIRAINATPGLTDEGLVVRNITAMQAGDINAGATTYLISGSDGTVPRNLRVLNVDPVAADYGVVTRNIPSGTQPVSGTVTANQGTPAAVTVPWPVDNGALAAVTGNITTGGADCTLGTSCVSMAVAGMASAAIFFSGTYTGASQLAVEASIDGGTTWFKKEFWSSSIGGTLALGQGLSPANNQSIIITVAIPGGVTHIRLRANALTSGTIAVRIAASATPWVSRTAAVLYSSSSGLIENPFAGANNSTPSAIAAGILTQFNDVAPTIITEGFFGNLRMSSNRNLYTTLRDAAGSERGVNVTPGNALTVDGSASTQPISAAQRAGATVALTSTVTNAQVDVSGKVGATAVLEAGTLDATLVMKVSYDGVNFVQVAMKDGTTTRNSLVVTNPNARKGLTVLAQTGYKLAQLIPSVYNSGTANATVYANDETDPFALAINAQAAGVAPVVDMPTEVGGKDSGGLMRSIELRSATPGVADNGVVVREAARGQANAAGSIPVVVANDQPAIPISASFAKAEDSPALDGDLGIMALAIRSDIQRVLTSLDLDYSALIVDALGNLNTNEQGYNALRVRQLVEANIFYPPAPPPDRYGFRSFGSRVGFTQQPMIGMS